MTSSLNATWRENFKLDLQNRSTELIIFETVMMAVIHLTTAVGNILFCLVIFKTPSLQNKTNLYITALAISDILKALIVMPLTLGVLIQGRWTFGYTLCQVQGFAIFFSTFGALQTMSLIALNRYFCVVKPQVYRKWFGRRNCIAMLVCVWLASFVVAVAPLVAQVAMFIFRGERSCCWITLPEFASNIAYTISCLILFIVWPFGVIIVLYLQVFRAICNHNKNITSHQISGPLRVSVREIRVTKQIFVLVLGFGACWIPCIIIELMDSFLPGGALPRSIYMMYIYLGYISSAINPILYGIMNQSFKAAFLNVLCCKNIDIHPNSVDFIANERT